MDRMMRMLETEIEKIPHNFLRFTLTSKLAEKGIKDKTTIDAIVEHILSGGDGEHEWDDGSEEEVIIEFTDQDSEETHKKMNDFLEESLPKIIQKSIDDCVNNSLRSYRQTAEKTLHKVRNEAKGFESRTFKRWKSAFDHLEMMWHIAQELGEAHSKDFDSKNLEDTHIVMAAISEIFPKALIVTREIICLLKGGYPDGALARWRSLHELTVSAMYILEEGKEPALNYMLSVHFSARRAAHQLNEHAERARMEPFSDEMLRTFDSHCAEAEKQLDRKIDRDKNGEWPAINLAHRNYADMERHVGMEHWRPRYKWASRHTHADFVPNDKLLGMSETKNHITLVGASNSGFADPLMMTAISLAQITNTYLSVTPNFDRTVHSRVILELSNEMNDIAIKTRDDTL
ncbi:DUF5677 domain-containing protein [Leisingera aquimarina]|uniref:DUF5677 domain-containing protein n=1 Tax=Leisingera aquimarina TaxID=476529 RepID=UPI000488003A|nr:DUF5677 domain-containing protein [Leisingera aquimarina]